MSNRTQCLQVDVVRTVVHCRNHATPQLFAHVGLGHLDCAKKTADACVTEEPAASAACTNDIGTPSIVARLVPSPPCARGQGRPHAEHHRRARRPPLGSRDERRLDHDVVWGARRYERVDELHDALRIPAISMTSARLPRSKGRLTRCRARILTVLADAPGATASSRRPEPASRAQGGGRTNRELPASSPSMAQSR